jgi:hypothetical protein
LPFDIHEDLVAVEVPDVHRHPDVRSVGLALTDRRGVAAGVLNRRLHG